MRARAACNDAFLICHEIYRAARELVGSRVATTQLLSPSKFLWRPDLRPHLVEYVADFARAGERALGAGSGLGSPVDSTGVRKPDRTGCGGEIAAPGREASGGGAFGNESRGRADRHRPGAPQFPRASPPDSFPHVLPGRRGIPRRAACPGNLGAHLVGLGRGDSPPRGRRADPRRNVSAGPLLQAIVAGATSAGVDKRARGENNPGPR